MKLQHIFYLMISFIFSGATVYAESKIALTSFNEGNSNHTNYFRLALSTPLSIDASVFFTYRYTV
jgi:hypothetical protein